MENLPFVSSAKNQRAVSVHFDQRLNHRKYQALLDDNNTKLLDVDDSYIRHARNPPTDTEGKELSWKLVSL